MTYTIDARSVRKSFGDHVVLDDVDLQVPTGSVLGLLGPNGAGKTTMVRILATLVRPDAGRATICGHDLVLAPHRVRSMISLTGQYAAVDEVLTAEENLHMMARLHHLPARAARERTDELLAEFDLTAARSRRAGTFSGGMRRRLDLALSMITRPPVLFLDEPTTGLDPRSREQTWNAVRTLVGGGTTILLTTQYLEEADQLADTIAVLDGGRIVAHGSPEDLKARTAGEVVRLGYHDGRALDDAVTALAPYEPTADRLSRSVCVETGGRPDEIRILLAILARAGHPPDTMNVDRPTLDDVFLSLTSTTAPEPTR